MGVTRKMLNWYAKLSPARGVTSPPYKHVVQIGDPVLRKVSEPVPIEKMRSDEMKSILKNLKYVLHSYDSVGMSAPQIGVNLRIFAIAQSATQIAYFPIEISKGQGMTVIPYTVFINPMMKVVDYNKNIYYEGCESIRGFAAEVPRYRKVEISGFNEEGEPVRREFKEWGARIVQHELDHLNGKLYTDTMDSKSFLCTCWEEVNLSQGNVVLPFKPE